MTDPDYRVEVEVGAHTFSATWPDPPAGNAVTLPLSVGWEVPEAVDFYPAQANATTGSFGIVCDNVGEVADLAIGDRVSIAMFVPSTAVDPWQTFGGVVTQLDASTGARPGDRARVRVYFSDPTFLLSQMVVGLVDWPLENVSDRLDRICAEAGITLAPVGFLDEGRGGLLAARSAGATDALSSIRSALRDNATRNTSDDPDLPHYGRDVYAYDPSTSTLYLTTWQRRVFDWPAELGADGTLHRRVGEPNALDGNAVLTDGRWVRLPVDRPSYVIVDGLVFPEGEPIPPGAVPYVRNTAYVDGPGPSFPSATARVFLGRSLVPDDTLPGVTWRTDGVRHLSYLDPVPVTGWVDSDDYVSGVFGLGWARIRPTVIEPIDPSLTLDGRTWIAGLLSGVRLTIPPGGKFYIDVTLRPELLSAYLPLSSGAATYADMPPALTYADLDPLLTYADLRLIGA